MSMSDESYQGFLLFAQNLATVFGGPQVIPTLYTDALPNWHRLSAEEQQIWKNRASQLPVRQATSPKRIDNKKLKKNPNSYGRSRKSKKLEQRREDFRPLPVTDEDSEDEIGALVEQIQDERRNEEMEEKAKKDLKMIKDTIMEQTGGCLDKIKNLRFLLASVQTFGNVDNICMMAEYAMNEFNLKDGVIDRFSTLVGPWHVENEVLRNRATFHSNETHQIPLTITSTVFDKRKLVIEVLGRTEPTIAAKQGLRVGLYTEENEDVDMRLNRLYIGEKNPYHLVNSTNRRWIICLRQEYQYMMASCQHLKSAVKLDYEGFPCTEDRYVFGDVFVEAVADCLGSKAIEECPEWLRTLGGQLPEDFSTPWERSGELFCSRHRRDRNACCATVTASRATFIILHSLEHLLRDF